LLLLIRSVIILFIDYLLTFY